MNIYVYAYRYIDDEIQGKGASVSDYLSLAANPGIYFIRFLHDGEWAVLEIDDSGSYSYLRKLDVPEEVKLHHLLTN